MNRLRSLDSTHTPWLLIDAEHRAGAELARKATLFASPAGWIRATVPGLSAQDLLAAGRITDPFHGDNVTAARWIEERDWVYRTSFEVLDAEAARPVRLVCESLDTFATVFLNGESIAVHENQFRRLFVELTGKLRVGTNHLAVAFEAPMPGTMRRAGPKLPAWNPPWERLYVRKSQMSYGWDWAARTPTVGIAGPIGLEFSDGVRCSDAWFRGRPVVDGSGVIRAELDVEGEPGTGLVAFLWVDGAVVAQVPVAIGHDGTARVGVEHAIAEPRLWFPRELGEPNLYSVALELQAGQSGERVVHRAEGRVGIRRIDVVLEDPASDNGKAFYFRVNGRRIWAKGDNWLPIDFLHTRVSPEQYRSYLQLLMASGVNCIRIWGGGIVEKGCFYELCDELGLLVWHDFGYACGIYPRDAAFLEEARREAEDIVVRLRSHACIALWCGNNENEVVARSDEDRFHPLYYRVLSDVVARLDPDTYFHAGSPSSPSGKVHPDSPDEGDRHNWDVWFGWQDSELITDAARFNSEFGAQAFPQRESLETFMHPDNLWTSGWVSHPEGPSPGYLMARHGAQLDKLLPRAAFYAPMRSLDHLIAATQQFQADTIGRYIRHYRRLLPASGGVVVWNFTSTWPSICWALVDFYRRPKQAYYECKRCFRPAGIGIEPDDASGARYTAYVSVDRAVRVEGSVSFELRELATGRVIANEEASVRLEGPTATAALSITVDPGLDRRRHALVATLHHAGGAERDIRYLTRVVDLQGLGGRLTATRHADRVELVSEGWRLRVGVESYETPAIWNDDYFDLLPGERRTLTIDHGAMPEHQWVVADMGTRQPLLAGATVEL